MSRFLTTLRLERFDESSNGGRGTWLLLSPLIYESDVANDVFMVPPGTTTDLASVPRLPFAYYLVGGLGHAAAVLHDYLYANGKVPRGMADAVFREALEVLGVSYVRRWAMWLGVRVGGSGSYQPA